MRKLIKNMRLYMLPIVFDSFYEYDEGVFLLTQSKLFKQMFENDLICQTELIYVTPEKKMRRI